MACNCILGRLRNDVGRNPAGPARWVTKRLLIAFAAKAARVWENSTSPASHSGGLRQVLPPTAPNVLSPGAGGQAEQALLLLQVEIKTTGCGETPRVKGWLQVLGTGQSRLCPLGSAPEGLPAAKQVVRSHFYR